MTHRAHFLRHGREGAEDAVGDLRAGGEGVGSVEERLLVLLKILVVCRRGAFDSDQQADELANGAARLASQELERVGVLFLRHQGRAGGVGVGQLDEPKLGGGVQDEVLGEARHVNHDHGRAEEKVQDEIAVSDSVERVRDHAIEAQVLGERGAVDVERVA